MRRSMGEDYCPYFFYCQPYEMVAMQGVEEERLSAALGSLLLKKENGALLLPLLYAGSKSA